jgi:hypothetical protein
MTVEEREFKVTKLPDDWRLSARATRNRNLYDALTPMERIQKQHADAKKKARARSKWKKKR